MTHLSEEQLHNLDHDTLVILFSSLQNQIELLDKHNQKLSEQLSAAEDNTAKLMKQVELLTEQVRLANQRHFGKKSEKALLAEADGQMSLFEFYGGDAFNEAEINSDDSNEPTIDEITVTYTRKKKSGKRDDDLKGLPVRVFNHTISDEELAREFPNGYRELPDEVYKRLFVIPRTFFCDEHHVHVYVSKDDSDHILRADRPADVFRNSIATPSLLAAIINAKYGQALPLDRQSKAFKQEGINLETNTLSNWVINSSDTYLSLIYNRMKQLMSDSKVIHADETPVDVMRMDGSNSGNKTYMWVYRNRPLRTSPPMVLFDWQPSRKPEHPREFLKDFNGTIVTDGYQVYHKLEKERDNLKVAGCWIHYSRNIVIPGEMLKYA